MPTYTLIITGSDGHQHKTLSEFPSDVVAIRDARGVVSEEHSSIAVARGVGDEVEFLGVWDWAPGSARWAADE